MVLVTTNKFKQLLFISYVGRVTPQELERSRAEIQLLLPDLKPGFRLLVDLTQLAEMGLDCVEEVSRNMELLDWSGVGTVVRVIPEPSKDIGMSILTLFHYPHHPHVVTCETVDEAGKSGLE